MGVSLDFILKDTSLAETTGRCLLVDFETVFVNIHFSFTDLIKIANSLFMVSHMVIMIDYKSNDLANDFKKSSRHGGAPVIPYIYLSLIHI